MEAMVVLVVAGMALMLVFAAGGRSIRQGFRLGDLALAAQRDQLLQDNLRWIIGAVVLRPTGYLPDASEAPGFEGSAQGFEAEAVLPRATACGPSGPARRLRLRLVRAARDVLVCSVGGGPEAPLGELDTRGAVFAYSTDGSTWSPRWSERLGAGLPTSEPRARRLFIRLSTPDGSLEIVGRASSDRPSLHQQRAIIDLEAAL